MFLIYILILHILSIVGLIVFWDPAFLILSIVGNCFFHLIGAEIFYHRYLSHKSFTCSTATKYFMTALSLFSGQGGPLSWSVHHRHHHKYSDTDQDPHTPKEDPVGMWFMPTNRRGNQLNVEISRDLIDQKWLQFLQDYYWYIHISLLALVALVDLRIFLYMLIIPNMLAIHQQGAINVLGHGYGYRNFDTPDNSTNSRWLSFITFGDCLQNNHHALPWSYTCAVKPGEFDISAWVIKNFLAKDVVETK